MYRGEDGSYGRKYSTAMLAQRNYRDLQKRERRQLILAIVLCLVWFFAGFAAGWIFWR